MAELSASTAEQKESHVQTPEKLLEVASTFKDSGNDAYKKKDFKEAVRSYHSCLMYARAAMMMSPKHNNPMQMVMGAQEGSAKADGAKEAMEKQANEVIAATHNNLVACFLANPASTQADFARALKTHMEEVLKKDPDNPKALFRKGELLLKLGSFEEAKEVYGKAQSLEPNAAIPERLKSCNDGIRERAEKQKKEWAGMFDRNKKSATNDKSDNFQNIEIPAEIAEIFAMPSTNGAS